MPMLSSTAFIGIKIALLTSDLQLARQNMQRLVAAKDFEVLLLQVGSPRHDTMPRASGWKLMPFAPAAGGLPRGCDSWRT